MRTVDRITGILRVVSVRAPHGVGLAELAQLCDLDRATALRLARALCETGWLRRHEDSGRYNLGVEAWLVGRRPCQPYDELVRLAKPQLRRLSKATGDTVYLAVRSGLEVVCIDRHDGSQSIAAKMGVGQRQSLGVGATGAALLSAMPPELREHLLTRLLSLACRGVERRALGAHFRHYDEQGCVFASGTVFYRVPALGFALHTPSGEPMAAISLAANESRLTRAHIETVAPLVRAARDAIQKRLHRLHV